MVVFRSLMLDAEDINDLDGSVFVSALCPFR